MGAEIGEKDTNQMTKSDMMKRPYSYLLILIVILLGGLLSACAGGASTVTSFPGVTVDLDSETVYLANGPIVYAINPANGAEKWRYPAEANNKISFYAAPALTQDGQVIVGGYDNVLYSLDAATGELNWTFTEAQNRYVASPLAHGEYIFAPSTDSYLYALDLDGNLRWKYQTGHEQWGTPAMNGTNVYVPGMDKFVYALNAESGELIWKTEPLGGAVISQPTLDLDGMLSVGTFGSELIALETSSGKVAWRLQAAGWVWSGPLLQDGILYVGDLGGKLHALNALDGSIIWQKDPDTSEIPGISGKPLILNDVLYYITRSGGLYAVDPISGDPRWSKTFEGEFYTSPIAFGDEVILISPYGVDQLLIALDASGNQKWSFTPTK